MYKIGMTQVCPQVVGMDTWNPVTGECGPGPSAGVIPATGHMYEPIVVTGPWLNPSQQDLERMAGESNTPSDSDTSMPEKKGNAALLFGIVAVVGAFVLFRK